MLALKDLGKVLRDRLKDAETLHQSSRYDGAVYLCGYVVELSLKYRICISLGWSDFPQTRKEFENYHNFKTHNLDVLLHLSGFEAEIKSKYFSEWSAAADWDPEARYRVGSAKAGDSRIMLSATKTLKKVLCRK